MSKPNKPQGKTGAVRVTAEGSTWPGTRFPPDEREREQLIADLFVKACAQGVATESQPSLAPFGRPRQNDEYDLDFTIETRNGDMLLELVEFAPLQVHGPSFEHVPKSLEPREKAELALEFVRKKSARQGGANRILLMYTTAYVFWLDHNTIERMRRALFINKPRFDRVYALSVDDLESACVSEIYPGCPHEILGDADLDAGKTRIPHPIDFPPVDGLGPADELFLTNVAIEIVVVPEEPDTGS